MPLKYALIFIVHKIYHIEARACLVRCDESMSNVSHTSSEIGWMLYNTRFVWMNVYESNCIYSPNCEIYNNYILICVRHSVQWQWRYGKMFSNTASDRTSKCSSFEQTVWNDQSNRLCLSFTLRLPLLKNAFRVPIKCNCAESWEPIVQRRAVLCCTAYVFEAKRIRSSCSSCIEGECNARLVDNQFDVGREEEKNTDRTRNQSIDWCANSLVRRQRKWRGHTVRCSNGEPQRNERRGGKKSFAMICYFFDFRTSGRRLSILITITQHIDRLWSIERLLLGQMPTSFEIESLRHPFSSAYAQQQQK